MYGVAELSACLLGSWSRPGLMAVLRLMLVFEKVFE